MINMFDEARSISTMLKARGMTQSNIAKMLGVSQPYIANKLRLLGFSAECQRLITEYGLSERHARAILRITGEEKRIDTITRIHEGGYTVHECEGLVDSICEKDIPRTIAEASPAKRLNSFFSTLDQSVLTLRSLGYKITKRTSYPQGRTLITITLDERLEYKNI